ncbi:MAG: hypothetical protein LUG60_06180 [Erysipelotrichaceae bacterium]|nr:hypothetical protein [Erysipelotrichaceae bacterium]
MNWYILYCMNAKTEKLCTMFRSYGVNAFIPRMEMYLRTKGLIKRDMFPSYIFIKSEMEQLEFNAFLKKLDYQKDGVIRELKYTDEQSLHFDFISALTKTEISMFEHLFDEQGIVRLSKVKFVNDQPVIYEGPLINYNYNIKKLDIHNGLAYLDIDFQGSQVVAGIKLEKIIMGG